MNIDYQSKNSPNSNQDEYVNMDTDLQDKCQNQIENDYFSNKIETHKFVVGISKPGEMRIGLQTINKNKITVKGILGIHEK
ncbi:unnamed protein product [Paramecium pentaurelia]|uniref:Uncharacterized protein n=1 Tax=Paramecium pentaurelia TaxID=43138 RepID=A0A8S1X1L8_9CILI|nr:unnamed protein product [Paramecium pentaurelia]